MEERSLVCVVSSLPERPHGDPASRIGFSVREKPVASAAKADLRDNQAGLLRRAFAKLDTLVVHESAWTATAHHAVATPNRQTRDDYVIFADLSERLGLAHSVKLLKSIVVS